jgi:C4-dicarboxylate transporter DctQ subunit
MKLEKLIDCGIPIFNGVLLAIMVISTFLQIIGREFFGYSFSWVEKIVQFCLMWLALIGSIWLTKNNRHMNTGLKLHQKLNKRLVCLIDGIVALVIAIVTAVVVYQTVIFTFMTRGGVFDGVPSWLKMEYVFSVLPLAMVAFCYYYLKNFFRNLVFFLKKDSPAETIF